MSTKISAAVVNGFAALAMMGTTAVQAGGSGYHPPAPPAPAPAPTPAPSPAPAPSTSGADAAAAAAAAAAAQAAAAAKATGTGVGVGKASSTTGDLTAQQQAALTAQQQLAAKQEAALTAQQKSDQQQKNDQSLVGGDQKLVGGDQKTTTQIDNSDRSVTKVTTPVSVAPVAGSFLVPPQIMQLCGVFNAKDEGGWGVGIQYEDKSFGFHYKGETTSAVKTDLDCLAAMNTHAARMQNLQFQQQTTLQAAQAGYDMDKIVYSTGGKQGQMVILQKSYAPEVKAIMAPDSDMQKFFGLAAAPAPAPAPAPKTNKPARKAAPKVCPCVKN